MTVSPCRAFLVMLMLPLTILPHLATAQVLTEKWVRVYDSGDIDTAVDLEIAPNGMVYVLGNSGPSAPYGGGDILLLAYGADGSLIWDTPTGDFGHGNDLDVDPWSRPIVAGRTQDYDSDVLVAQFSTQGDTLWAFRFTEIGIPWNEAFSVVVHDSGVIYAAGECDYCSHAAWQPILVSLSPNGDLLCSNIVDVMDRTQPRTIALFDSGVYMAGATIPPPDGDIAFVMRFGFDCEAHWLHPFYFFKGAFARAISDEVVTGGFATVGGQKDALVTRQSWLSEVLDVATFDLAQGDDEIMAMTDRFSAGYGTTTNGDRDILTGWNLGGFGEWHHTFDGPGDNGDDTGVDLTLLGNDYLVTLGTVDAGYRGQDIVVLLYDTDGTYYGQEHYSGPGDTPDVAVAIKEDGQGSVYVAGNTGDDIILIKYSLSGTGVLPGPRPVVPMMLTEPAPNPSQGPVTFAYQLEEAMPVVLRVLDAQGRVVHTLDAGLRGPGRQDITWDGRTDLGRGARSGIYFLNLTAGNRSETRRLVLIH